jgi:hypothetical protein
MAAQAPSGSGPAGPAAHDQPAPAVAARHATRIGASAASIGQRSAAAARPAHRWAAVPRGGRLTAPEARQTSLAREARAGAALVLTASPFIVLRCGAGCGVGERARARDGGRLRRGRARCRPLFPLVWRVTLRCRALAAFGGGAPSVSALIGRVRAPTTTQQRPAAVATSALAGAAPSLHRRHRRCLTTPRSQSRSRDQRHQQRLLAALAPAPGAPLRAGCIAPAQQLDQVEPARWTCWRGYPGSTARRSGNRA